MKAKDRTNQSIGFIGAGNMGLPMLKNLIKQGYDVKVYDINPKITKRLEEDVEVFDGGINKEGNVFGTYIHGVFDNISFTREMLNKVRELKGLGKIESSISSFDEFKEREYQKLAKIVRENVDMDKIYQIVAGE